MLLLELDDVSVVLRDSALGQVVVRDLDVACIVVEKVVGRCRTQLFERLLRGLVFRPEEDLNFRGAADNWLLG